MYILIEREKEHWLSRTCSLVQQLSKSLVNKYISSSCAD